MFNGRRKFWDAAFWWFLKSYDSMDCGSIKEAAHKADMALTERKKRWNLLQRIMNIFSL